LLIAKLTVNWGADLLLQTEQWNGAECLLQSEEWTDIYYDTYV